MLDPTSAKQASRRRPMLWCGASSNKPAIHAGRADPFGNVSGRCRAKLRHMRWPFDALALFEGLRRDAVADDEDMAQKHARQRAIRPGTGTIIHRADTSRIPV